MKQFLFIKIKRAIFILLSPLFFPFALSIFPFCPFVSVIFGPFAPFPLKWPQISADSQKSGWIYMYKTGNMQVK